MVYSLFDTKIARVQIFFKSIAKMRHDISFSLSIALNWTCKVCARQQRWFPSWYFLLVLILNIFIKETSCKWYFLRIAGNIDRSLFEQLFHLSSNPLVSSTFHKFLIAYLDTVHDTELNRVFILHNIFDQFGGVFCAHLFKRAITKIISWGSKCKHINGPSFYHFDNEWLQFIHFREHWLVNKI